MHSITEGPVAALAADVSAVLDDDLTRYSDDQLTEVLRMAERCTRQLAAFFTKALVETEERSIPRRAGCTSTASYLQDVLRLSRSDATARVTAAKKLGTWHDVGGHEIPVDLPATSKAQQGGDISPEHARKIAAVMHDVPAALPRAHRDEAEKILAECARDGTPEDVRKAGDRLLSYLDPDGKLTDDRDRQRRRAFRIGPQGPDLMSPVSGCIDPTLRALLDALLAKHAKPGMNNPDDPNPADPADAATKDVRTAAQRNHDALKRICEIALESGKSGSHRGLPVTAIITMTLDQLEEAAGVATTATGGRIPVSDALKMAEKTRPWLAIFDHAGRPLHLGRSSRLASGEQRLVLIPFDRGCTKPGCDKPPTLCAVHHVKDWVEGGETDIDGETFACDGCHALVTRTENGWQTIKADDNHEFPGRTLWIPPKHIDPEQKPRINHCHHPEELLDRAIKAAIDAAKKSDDDP
ncbi:HNH endonuclease signature motif containing protein [Antrihabitans cavernicola]|uniref:DUF222 domain-containing protein n=1 Tax=Antrihabitans cavernicola TaxID=2495913 RepID=A0A5A7S814_9NOCA|nr:HNH endonuclease signature motif containing protein [Spelaeibacter cavernicola]KAA0022298.1 DUF222 domain-containing protein [Spelaeibacter cavernicola]